MSRWWVLLLGLLVLGCGPKRIKTQPAPGPDLGGIVSVGTREGWAHACPICPRVAITSGHVVDPSPNDPGVPLVGGRWSDGWGNRGYLQPFNVWSSMDLALVRPYDDSPDFSRWYRVATEAPFPQQPLYVLGYDKRTKEDAFAPRRYEVRFVYEAGGRLVLSAETGTGSSGSCVLTADGQVVGVMESTWVVGESRPELIGVAVSVWGEKLDACQDGTPVVAE